MPMNDSQYLDWATRLDAAIAPAHGKVAAIFAEIREVLRTVRRENDELKSRNVELQAQLNQVHSHVKTALEQLRVDVLESGYIPDSWTLVEECKMSGDKLARVAEWHRRMVKAEDELARLKHPRSCEWVYPPFDEPRKMPVVGEIIEWEMEKSCGLGLQVMRWSEECSLCYATKWRYVVAPAAPSTFCPHCGRELSFTNDTDWLHPPAPATDKSIEDAVDAWIIENRKWAGEYGWQTRMMSPEDAKESLLKHLRTLTLSSNPTIESAVDSALDKLWTQDLRPSVEHRAIARATILDELRGVTLPSPALREVVNDVVARIKRLAREMECDGPYSSRDAYAIAERLESALQSEPVAEPAAPTVPDGAGELLVKRLELHAKEYLRLYGGGNNTFQLLQQAVIEIDRLKHLPPAPTVSSWEPAAEIVEQLLEPFSPSWPMFVPIQDVIDEIRNLPVSEPAPPEREPIPEGVYYSTSVDNFCDIDKLGLGNDFWMKWISRRDEFPKSADEAKVRAVENKESKT